VRRAKIEDLHSRIGQTVRVCGYVSALRLQRKMQFVIVNDASGAVQVTHRRGGADDEIEQQLERLTPASAVAITGEVLRNEIVKLGGIELIPSQVEVLARSEAALPIGPESGPDVRQDWRFLDIRLHPQRRFVFDVATAIETALREFVTREGFFELHTPKLMGTASESGAEVFQLDYFGRPAYLAQSPQFYKQMAIASGIDKVFEVGPVFRAEPSFTSRHATEFTGVDVEMAWIDDVEDVMQFKEQMLRHMLEKVRDRYGDQIHDAYGVDVVVPVLPFPRIPLGEARRILQNRGWEPIDKADLDPAGERMISEYVRHEFGSEFVYLTEYPTSVRPFYHMRPTPDVTASFDLVWKGLEITTGAQREHRYDVLVHQAVEKGLDPESMRSYLDIFRFGTPPHGGFGMGLNRVLMLLLGLPSIRDATFLFRGPHRLEP
jgi:aspartyl-tRNA synthetase